MGLRFAAGFCNAGAGGDVIGLIGPMRPRLGECHGDDLRARSGGRGRARVGRAAAHPLGEHGDGIGAERFLRRHLQVFVSITDGVDEQAGVGSAGDDYSAAVAAGLPAGH